MFCLTKNHLRIFRHLASHAVNVLYYVLEYGRSCPQELAGLSVQRVHHAGLAGNTGDDLANFASLQIRVNPLNFVWIGGHCGVHEQALKRMVHIPVIIEMLVVPAYLTGIYLQRQGTVVIQILLINAI